MVIVGFLLEKNGDVAAQEVRDKVNSVLPQLPRTIQRRRVEKLDPDAAPVLSHRARRPTRPVRDITEYADKVAAPAARERSTASARCCVIGGRSAADQHHRSMRIGCAPTT